MKIKDMTKRIGYVGVYVVALFLLACLLIGQMKYALPETPIVVAFSTLVLSSFYYWGKKNVAISNKYFWISASTFLVLTFLVEVYVINALPFDWASDPRLCKEQAEYMLTTWSLKPELNVYFSMYPNNINILIILGALYRLFGDYNMVIYLFLVLVNLSSLCSSLIVRNITNNNFASLTSLLLLQVFCIFTTRTYMPYTSNLALIFPALMFYVYTSKLSKAGKTILIPIIAAIGWQAKVTSLIAFIAIIIVEGFRYVTYIYIYTKRDLIISVSSTLVAFSLLACVKSVCWNQFHYQIDESRAKGYVYFCYLGQNTQSGGQWDAEYVKKSEYVAPKAERDAYYLSIIKRDVKERGVLGNIKFYVAKTAICWGCTYQDYTRFDGKDNKWIFAFRHSIWFLVFACAVLSIFICRNKYNLAMMLTLAGVMCYLFLSEGSFTYVIMFSPIVFAMAGITFANISNKRLLDYAKNKMA